MFGKLGLAGVLGLLLIVGGIGVVAWKAPVVAAGIAFVIAGLGLVVYGMIKNLISSLGLGALS